MATEKERLLLALVPRVFRGVPGAAIINSINAVLVAVVFTLEAESGLLAAWTGAVLLVAGFRMLAWWRFNRTPLDRRNIRFWSHVYLLGAGLQGLTWGAAGILLFTPDALPLQVFLILVIGGMGAGALVVSSHYMRAFHAFFFASMPFITISVASMGTVMHTTLAILMVIFMAAMYVFARYLGETIREMVTLELEREALLDQFRDFAEMSGDWFWETGPDMRFTYLSDQVRHVLGLPPSHFIGRTQATSIDWEDSADAWHTYMEMVDARAAFRDLVCSIKHPPDHKTYVALSGKPIFSPDGRFLGYRGTGRQIGGPREVISNTG